MKIQHSNDRPSADRTPNVCNEK